MATNSNHLRIGHLNVRGLERHIDDMKLLLNKKQYHFFGLSETKLKVSAPVGPIKIPGYNFIRHSLPCGRGRGSKTCGGVGFYVAKHIKVKTISKSHFDADVPIAQRFEYLAVSANINNYNVCVVALYNPRCNNQSFINFDRIYIVGDYNINVSSTVVSGNLISLRNLHNTFNLTVLKTPPTRITESTASKIDLLVTDSPDSILKSSTSTGNAISDHDVIYLIADIRVRKPTPQRHVFRNLRRIDQVCLQADFLARDLRPMIKCNDIDRKAELVTAELQLLLDRHAPEQTTFVRDRRTPWITSDIEQAIQLRDLAFKLYSRNPNRTLQWQDYCTKRDRTRTLIATAKKRYAERNFCADLPAKKLWNNLRRDGIHKIGRAHV